MKSMIISKRIAFQYASVEKISSDALINARRTCKIENETHNTLKNQGFPFELNLDMGRITYVQS